MSFIETLKSVGGVKPCRHGDIVDFGHCKVVPLKRPDDKCPDCHGTGTVLDLAPLLAKPRELVDVVGDYEDSHGNGLLSLLARQPLTDNTSILWSRSLHPTRENLYVVGPQRAHSLVYEIARQLGGTAVVAEHGYWDNDKKPWDEPWYGEPSKYRFNPSYRLSLPIPPDATVLFVVDKVDEKEMNAVIQAALPDPVAHRVGGGNCIPYVLSLVSAVKEIVVSGTAAQLVSTSMKVIALYKEPA